ncbi:MAG: signal recognition particle-docking protein FtsY [Candidatus Caenarcaniphilales bacterium]|jgi:fused signal recognition particle receptor|nr:signal recognition particle-docking protein FtsY [Candidatus Caenarcaniphilales bacterium]
MSFLSGIFNKIQNIFSQNTEEQNANIQVAQKHKLTETDFDKLEEELIRSDLTVTLVLDFVASLRSKAMHESIFQEDIKQHLSDFLLRAFDKIDKKLFKLELNPHATNVILVVGVNGVGKTTSIAKLAKFFKDKSFKVMIAAGDTFRAAAEEQLETWAKRIEVDICKLEEGSKPSTVVFKAIEKAKQEGHQLIIIDTAGRLQNKQDLMNELGKLKQVIEKNLADTEHQIETMLVLDSGTGSNAISQAEKFNEATKLDSIFLSKFDGSAKAGMVFALAHKFKLPVKFMGTGEKAEDIQEFNLEEFTAKYL